MRFGCLVSAINNSTTGVIQMNAKLALGILFAAFVSLFATSAFAQSVDVRVGLNGSVLDWSDDINGWGDVMAGPGVNLEIGANWGGLGIYLSQDINALWWTGSTGDEMSRIGKDNARFLGGTYLMFRAIVGERFLVGDFGIGLGAMYSGRGDWLDGEDYARLIPTKGTNDAPAAFAMKLSLGFALRVTKQLMVGLHFDYAVGFSNLKGSHRYYGYDRDSMETHSMMPGIHFLYQI